jgi:hypothetical protein
VLSLLVVPAVFTYVDDLGNGWRRLLRKLRRQPADNGVAPPPPAPTARA